MKKLIAKASLVEEKRKKKNIRRRELVSANTPADRSFSPLLNLPDLATACHERLTATRSRGRCSAGACSTM